MDRNALASSRVHALSIDLEDWYHPELVRRHVAPAERVGHALAATRPLLDLLARYKTRATFFVVGEVAAACPDLVRQIAERGHEIGCHGWSHRTLWDLSPATLDAELNDCRRLMEDILGTAGAMQGFRAPTFSLDQRTAWAVDVLADAGYRYDSSVFPVRSALYGVSGAPTMPYRLSGENVRRPDPAGRLVEFPMSVAQMGPLKVTGSGGAYLRLLPMPLLTWLLRRIAVRTPFVVYVHPWETSPETPVLRLPLLDRMVTYYNIGGALGKLEHLLREFRFAPLRDVLSQLGMLN